ncbi:MAG: isoprenylcysteine carboxylmethyltransferase family protein [Halobacteriota archaeon]
MVEVLTSDMAAALFTFVYFLMILTEIIGGIIVPRVRRHGTEIKKKERGSGRLISVSVVVSFIVAYFLALSGITLMPSWVFYPGIVLMFLGIMVRQWSMAVLGRFFSPTIGVQEGQKVVDRGPYRLVRHPSYTGILLILVGVGLAFQSLAAILVILLIFSVAYGYRMNEEEKVLTLELGDEYVKYAKRTKRLIPYLV